jgi:hypothetical protein
MALKATRILVVDAIVVLDQTDPQVAAGIVELQRASYAVEADLIRFDAIPPLQETAADVSGLELTILGALDGGSGPDPVVSAGIAIARFWRD